MGLTADSGEPLSSLAEFITQRMDTLGLTYRAVAQRSGGLVSHAQVHHLASGKGRSQGISQDVLKGLCKALRCTQADILDRMEIVYAVAYEPPPEAAWLSEEQRKVVDAVIRQLAVKHLDD